MPVRRRTDAGRMPLANLKQRPSRDSASTLLECGAGAALQITATKLHRLPRYLNFYRQPDLAHCLTEPSVPKGPGDYAYRKRCWPSIQTVRIG